MRSGGVCNPSNVLDHEGWEIDLLTSVHEIDEALVHCIRLISSLPSGDDILDEKPENKLVERQHITLLHSLGVFQPWLLT